MLALAILQSVFLLSRRATCAFASKCFFSLSHTRIHIPLGSLYRHLMTKAQLICMFSAPFITALFCANLYHNWAWGQQQLYIRTAQRPLRRVFFYAEMQIFRKHSVCQLIKVVWWLILTREDSFAAAHEIIYLLCLELLIEQYCSGICNSLMEIKKIVNAGMKTNSWK